MSVDASRLPRELPDRFRSKVRIDPDTGCWLWTAHITPSGYGGFWNQGANTVAHRFAYEVLVGPIPDGLQLDHLCRVRACCNPEHVEPVTCQENLLRGETLAARFGFATHCVNGHEFDEENTYHRKTGGRMCRTCTRERMRQYRATKRAGARR